MTQTPEPSAIPSVTYPRPAWFSEAIILAFLSAFTYFLTFKYESGYCAHFQIPEELIQLDLSRVLVFAAVLYPLLVVLYTFQFILFRRTADMPPPSTLRRYLQQRHVVLFIGILALLAHQFSRTGWLIAGGTLIALLLLDVVPAWLQGRKHGSFAVSLDATVKSWYQADIFAPVQERFGVGPAAALFGCYMLIMVTPSIAAARAGNTTFFLVPDSNPGLVVVRIYGRQAICVPADTITRKTQRKVIVIDLSNQPISSFTWKRVGPLQVGENK